MQDRPFYPSADRNKGPILEVLSRLTHPGARVLEIASGTGQHTAHFAAALPGCRFQPTDGDAEMRDSIAAWTSALNNVEPPRTLDASAAAWAVEGPFEVVVCTNMIHISPWAATTGLFAGAARVLIAGGALLTYGPYLMGANFTAESNAAFDRSLRARDAAWGIRSISALKEAAASAGFSLEETVPRPANNHCLVWRLDPAPTSAG